MIQIPFPNKKYSVIYADPPWSYGDKGFGKRPFGSESGSFAPEAGRYETMSLEEIKNLPVKNIVSDNCALLLWATSPLLPEAMEVITSWGFKYKTVAFCWVKVEHYGKDVSNLGQWTLGNIELCLLGTKGSPKRMDRTVRQLVKEERTFHSRKPSEVRKRITKLFGDGPKIELFARQAVKGWDSWGDQVEPIEQESSVFDFMKPKNAH